MKTKFDHAELSLLNRSLYKMLEHCYDELARTDSKVRKKLLNTEANQLEALSFKVQSFMFGGIAK